MCRRNGFPDRRHDPGRRLKGQQGSGGSATEDRGRRRVAAAENGWDIKHFGGGFVFHWRSSLGRWKNVGGCGGIHWDFHAANCVNSR